MPTGKLSRRPMPMRLFALALVLGAAACTGKTEYNYPDQKPGQRIDPTGSNKQYDGLLGQDGFNVFGSSKPEDQGGGIGVNSYLWRASLDSISFMPLSSADPFGGVIITDWYSPPESPNERFKLNIYILGRQLRVICSRDARGDLGGVDPFARGVWPSAGRTRRLDRVRDHGESIPALG